MLEYRRREYTPEHMDYDDILCEILRWINTGSSYKSCTRVCRLWKRLTAREHPTARAKFANHLLTLILMFPNAQWRWHTVSKNPNITYAAVHAHPELPWDWHGFSMNPSVDWETIAANPEDPWVWGSVVANPNVTPAHMESRPGLWDSYAICRNPNLTLEELVALPDHEEFVYDHPAVTIKWLLEHGQSDYEGMSGNPNLTWEDVAAHPTANWDIHLLSTHPNIKVEHILEGYVQFGFSWCYECMYRGDNIPTGDLITRVPAAGIKCNPCYLSFRLPRAELPAGAFDCVLYSSNPHLTWEDIAANPEAGWRFDMISENKFGWKKTSVDGH
jgi:hypothetical protein